VTFTIPDFWCGFIAGNIVMLGLLLALGQAVLKRKRCKRGTMT
jgi:hypothetical protein